MNDYLTLSEAACFLQSKGCVFSEASLMQRIIVMGAQAQVPVYWRNSAQLFSALFTSSGTSDERAMRWMRLSLTSLSKLEVAHEIDVAIFEPDDADPPPAVEGVAFRGLIELGQDHVRVSRDALAVRRADIEQLHGELSALVACDDGSSAEHDDKGSAELALTREAIFAGNRRGGSAADWVAPARTRAAEIIEEQKERDLYPSQEALADQIAREFRASGVVGAGGKPLTGAYIKRHALKGISSATGKQKSTSIARGK